MKKGFTLKGKKLNLIILVIGIIMISIVGTKAATTIGSNMVTYNDTTVKETLDNLVDITVQGNATSSDILAGKTAVVQGQLVEGSLAIPSKDSKLVGSVTATGNYKNGSTTNVNFDLSSYPGYQNITVDDFYLHNMTATLSNYFVGTWTWSPGRTVTVDNCQFKFAYDPITGILNVTGGYGVDYHRNGDNYVIPSIILTGDIYVVY